MRFESDAGEWGTLDHGARRVNGPAHKPPYYGLHHLDPPKPTLPPLLPSTPNPTLSQLHVVYGTLNACSDLTPTHQLAE